MLKKHDLGLLTCRPSSLASGYGVHNDRSLSSRGNGQVETRWWKSASGKVLAQVRGAFGANLRFSNLVLVILQIRVEYCGFPGRTVQSLDVSLSLILTGGCSSQTRVLALRMHDWLEDQLPKSSSQPPARKPDKIDRTGPLPVNLQMH
jgi:hypothetical protein